MATKAERENFRCFSDVTLFYHIVAAQHPVISFSLRDQFDATGKTFLESISDIISDGWRTLERITTKGNLKNRKYIRRRIKSSDKTSKWSCCCCCCAAALTTLVFYTSEHWNKNLIAVDESQQTLSRYKTINLIRAVCLVPMIKASSSPLLIGITSLGLAAFVKVQNRYLYRPSDVGVDLHTSPRTASLRLFIGNRFLYFSLQSYEEEENRRQIYYWPAMKIIFQRPSSMLHVFFAGYTLSGSLTWYESIKPATFFGQIYTYTNSLPIQQHIRTIWLWRCCVYKPPHHP